MTGNENEKQLRKLEIKIARLAEKKFFGNRIEREWLTTQQAAEVLGVSENALRIMVHRDQIKAYKLGRRLRFKADLCQALFKWRGA